MSAGKPSPAARLVRVVADAADRLVQIGVSVPAAHRAQMAFFGVTGQGFEHEFEQALVDFEAANEVHEPKTYGVPDARRARLDGWTLSNADEPPTWPPPPRLKSAPAPGAMQDMGARCTAAAEMFPQHTTTSPGAAGGSQQHAAGVAGERVGVSESIPGRGADHSDSAIITALANQLQLYRDGVPCDANRRAYLDELIPEARDLASQFAAEGD
ncbi:MAG: hypothetical protein WBB07_23940 [Mycobacterium sp.]